MIANIGKGVLYQMIGIRDNDKKTTLQIDDLQKNSPCAGCPWMKAAQSNPNVEAGCELLKTRCSECKDRCFNPENIQIHTEYIYESRYGNRCYQNQTKPYKQCPILPIPLNHFSFISLNPPYGTLFHCLT